VIIIGCIKVGFFMLGTHLTFFVASSCVFYRLKDVNFILIVNTLILGTCIKFHGPPLWRWAWSLDGLLTNILCSLKRVKLISHFVPFSFT
jgi:hypothetical protein